MRVFGLVLICFAIAVPLLLSFRPAGGGFIMTQVMTDRTLYDITGAGLRQMVVRVGDAAGNNQDIPLSLFGPIDRIVEPWTAVQASQAGLQVEVIGSPDWKVPAGHFVLLWDPNGTPNARWRAYSTKLPSFENAPLSDGRRLLDALVEQEPEYSEFLQRLLFEGGLR